MNSSGGPNIPGAGMGPAVLVPPKVSRSKLCNYSVRFSPFEGNKLALAQAQYFGVVGAGGV